MYGVLVCNDCNTVWDRDTNAARNIRRVLETVAAGEDRPQPLQRGDKRKKQRGRPDESRKHGYGRRVAVPGGGGG